MWRISKQPEGFTLIEVLVSLFAFLIIMTAVTNTFISGFSSYKNTKAAQKDVENAQFAMNSIAKELRTSTVVSSTATTVRFYDYSQGRCIEYQLDAGELKVSKRAPLDIALVPTDCTSSGYPLPTALIKSGMPGGSVTGRFRVVPSASSPSVVGKVTLSLQIQEGSSDMARIQTTVSLRDYSFSGLQ